jgi:hypothetical protein
MKPGPIPKPWRETMSGFFLSLETFEDTNKKYGKSSLVSAK